MKLMLMAGSLRKDSVNKKLIAFSKTLLEKEGVVADIKQFSDYPHSAYDGDIEANLGLPEGINHFIADINQYDGLIFSIPEYNFSISGAFKNFFDWTSRARPMPWMGKKVLLMSASPAGPGGIRGLWQSRIPFEGCGAFVYPEMFALSDAYNAFNAEGALADQSAVERLQTLFIQFTGFVRKLTSL